MAGEKNYSVVSVTAGLTQKQASELVSEISKAKNKVAPNSRSTAALTTRENIGSLLQKGIKQITGGKN